jgi:hypothetical protein
VFHNFVRTHKAHKLSPAMAAGVSDRLWSIDDVIAVVDAGAPKRGKRALTNSGENQYKRKAPEGALSLFV